MLETKPIAGALGAEIDGIDLSGPLSNSEATDVRQALLDHKVIFFRDQELTPEDHLRVSALFGNISRVQFVQCREGYPDIIEIVKEPEDAGKLNFGGAWHSDTSYEKEPALGSALYALETPPYGGDTLWTNMQAAYAALSDGMKAMLNGLNALHSGERYFGSGGYFKTDETQSVSMSIKADTAGDARVAHPVVRTHPDTGAKCLYVNPAFTICFEDMTEEESAPLLGFLFEHAIRPEFQCRFNWTAGTLAVWDNRATMHFAINDYDGYRRHMDRVTIAGDRPR